MKLTKIKVVNFGQFSDFTFELPESNLTVFFGANEAGKSTIVAFIKQVLFGFHLAKHTSAFFEDYKPLARVSPMGGSLFFTDEQANTFELERLYAPGKGSKVGTLTVKRNGQVVPENIFFDQLKNIDGEFYSDSFIFNQDMLAKVGTIGQTDLLERIYYLGAANSDKLIDLRDDFAKKASTLFKKGGTNPPLNQLLKQLKEQKIKVDEAEEEFSDYQELQKQFSDQQAQLTEQEALLTKLQDKQKHAEQLQRLLPSYQKLTKLKQEVKTVSFDEQQYQKAQNLLIEKQNLQKQTENLQKRLAKVAGQDNLLQNGHELVQKKPEVLQWRSEYRSCLQKQKQIASEKEQLVTLNPALAKVADFSQDQMVTLQTDYQNLSLKDDSSRQNTQTDGRYWLIGSGLIIILGLILLVINSPLFGGAALLGGIVCGMCGFTKQKQAREVKAQQEEQKDLAQKQRAAFTSKYELEPDQLDLPNLLNAWRQYQLQIQKEKAVESQEEDLLLQSSKLADKISQLLHQEVQPDFESILTALDQLETQENLARQSSEEKASLQGTIADNNSRIKELDLKLNALFAAANVTDMAGYTALKSAKLKQEQLQAEINVLATNLKQDMAELKLIQQDTALQSKLQDLLQQIANQQEKIRQLQATKAELSVKMTNLANSNAVFLAKQDLANLKTKFQNLSTEYLADLAVSRWIARALDLASNERFPKMLVLAKEYLRLLTNNRYNSIEIDKKLTVTRYDGKKIKVQYLSRGTSEQLYFALKLAFVQQIKDQINLPILIDDSFVNFDDQRVDQIKQLLDQVAQNNQVLIFTAQSTLVEKLHIQPLTFRKGTENV